MNERFGVRGSGSEAEIPLTPNPSPHTPKKSEVKT